MTSRIERFTCTVLIPLMLGACGGSVQRGTVTVVQRTPDCAVATTSAAEDPLVVALLASDYGLVLPGTAEEWRARCHDAGDSVLFSALLMEADFSLRFVVERKVPRTPAAFDENEVLNGIVVGQAMFGGEQVQPIMDGQRSTLRTGRLGHIYANEEEEDGRMVVRMHGLTVRPLRDGARLVLHATATAPDLRPDMQRAVTLMLERFGSRSELEQSGYFIAFH